MQSKMLKFHSGKMLSIFFPASELDNVFLIFAGKRMHLFSEQMEVFDLQMLPFKSKPTKNLIWPENMSHIFQLVGENFFRSCTVCLGKCLCKYPFPRFISAKFLNSAVEIQNKKTLLYLGRNYVGEETSFLASRMLLYLFFRAQALPWCKKDRSGSSSYRSDGVRSGRSLLKGSTFRNTCVLLERNAA